MRMLQLPQHCMHSCSEQRTADSLKDSNERRLARLHAFPWADSQQQQVLARYSNAWPPHSKQVRYCRNSLQILMGVTIRCCTGPQLYSSMMKQERMLQ